MNHLVSLLAVPVVLSLTACSKEAATAPAPAPPTTAPAVRTPDVAAIPALAARDGETQRQDLALADGTTIAAFSKDETIAVRARTTTGIENIVSESFANPDLAQVYLIAVPTGGVVVAFTEDERDPSGELVTTYTARHYTRSAAGAWTATNEWQCEGAACTPPAWIPNVPWREPAASGPICNHATSMKDPCVAAAYKAARTWISALAAGDADKLGTNVFALYTGETFAEAKATPCQRVYTHGAKLVTADDRAAFTACFARDTKRLGWPTFRFESPTYDDSLASLAESAEDVRATWTAATPNSITFDASQAPSCKTLSVALAQTNGAWTVVAVALSMTDATCEGE